MCLFNFCVYAASIERQFLSLSKGASLSSWERHTLPFSLCFTSRVFFVSAVRAMHIKVRIAAARTKLEARRVLGRVLEKEVCGGGKRSACSWLGGSECLPCSLVKSTSPSRAQQLVELDCFARFGSSLGTANNNDPNTSWKVSTLRNTRNCGDGLGRPRSIFRARGTAASKRGRPPSAEDLLSLGARARTHAHNPDVSWKSIYRLEHEKLRGGMGRSRSIFRARGFVASVHLRKVNLTTSNTSWRVSTVWSTHNLRGRNGSSSLSLSLSGRDSSPWTCCCASVREPVKHTSGWLHLEQEHRVERIGLGNLIAGVNIVP